MRTSLMTALVLGIALGSLPFAANAAAPGKSKAKAKQAAKASDLTVLHALHNTNRLLAKTEPIYRGHRNKAMHAVNRAIGNLEKEAARHGLKVTPHKHPKEAVVRSNAQIIKARSDLATILNVLSSMRQTKLRAQAIGHVKTAIGELGHALAAQSNRK